MRHDCALAIEEHNVDIFQLEIGKFERLMTARWALALTAAIVFIDTCLILRYGINFASVDTLWLSQHSAVPNLIILLAGFGISFGLLIPGTMFVMRVLLSLLWKSIESRWFSGGLEIARGRGRESIDRKKHVHKVEFRHWAIRTSNMAAYLECDRHITLVREAAFTRYLCQCILGLSLIGWICAPHNAPPLIVLLYRIFDELPRYQDYPLRALLAGFNFFLVAIAFQEKDPYEDYVYCVGHGIEPIKITVDRPLLM